MAAFLTNLSGSLCSSGQRGYVINVYLLKTDAEKVLTTMKHKAEYFSCLSPAQIKWWGLRQEVHPAKNTFAKTNMQICPSDSIMDCLRLGLRTTTGATDKWCWRKLCYLLVQDHKMGNVPEDRKVQRVKLREALLNKGIIQVKLTAGWHDGDRRCFLCAGDQVEEKQGSTEAGDKLFYQCGKEEKCIRRWKDCKISWWRQM